MSNPDDAVHNGVEYIEPEAEELALLSEKLTDTIRPILAGNDFAVIGATLAQLLALFLAGHHPSLREDSLAKLIACTRELIEPTVEEFIESGNAPPEWR